MRTDNIIRLKLKRVDPVKYATISAILTMALMLIIFVPFMLFFSAIGIATEDLGVGAAFFGGGIIMIVIVPLIYGVLVFIITLLITALMNFILKKTGGLDIDFEKTGLDISLTEKE